MTVTRRLTPEAAKLAAAEVGIPEVMADLSVFQKLFANPSRGRRPQRTAGDALVEGLAQRPTAQLLIMRIGWSTGSVHE